MFDWVLNKPLGTHGDQQIFFGKLNGNGPFKLPIFLAT